MIQKITHKYLLTCKGKRFEGTILEKEIKDAKIQVEDGTVYICQNFKDGFECQDKLGYKYSWLISRTVEKYEEDNNDCENIKIIEEDNGNQLFESNLLTFEYNLEKDYIDIIKNDSRYSLETAMVLSDYDEYSRNDLCKVPTLIKPVKRFILVKDNKKIDEFKFFSELVSFLNVISDRELSCKKDVIQQELDKALDDITPIDNQSDFKSKLNDTLRQIEFMLLEKNRKYGNSALEPLRVFSKADNVEQIKVRIDDKINRLKNQQQDDIEDTVNDLIGYLILLKIAKKGK